jgi:hypothetical protein
VTKMEMVNGGMHEFFVELHRHTECTDFGIGI